MWTQPNVVGKLYNCDPINKSNKLDKRIGDNIIQEYLDKKNLLRNKNNKN